MAWLTLAATRVGVGVGSSASAYPWWLDVETANSWETGTSGLANNVADLQGMVAAFRARGATVGIYSTTYQWGQITGGSKGGNLSGLPDWIPGLAGSRAPNPTARSLASRARSRSPSGSASLTTGTTPARCKGTRRDGISQDRRCEAGVQFPVPAPTAVRRSVVERETVRNFRPMRARGRLLSFARAPSPPGAPPQPVPAAEALHRSESR